MTKNQTWVAMLLSFILLVFVIIGGCFVVSLKLAENILSSPASTIEIDIDADTMWVTSEDGELKLEYIHLNRIQGKMNSKILDLILLVIANERQ